MAKPFKQVEWDAQLEDDCRHLIRLAVREDLDRGHDWTTLCLVDEDTRGRAKVVSRAAGKMAGLPAAALVAAEYDPRIEFKPLVSDGDSIDRGVVLAELSGPARSLLAAERPLLNLLGRLCGVASLTDRYVQAVVGSRAGIYDTRKTMPGWRRLDKYAVRMGGGHNHRTGLFDGILIKDNHLALGAQGRGEQRFSPADAVRRARHFLEQLPDDSPLKELVVEVEVDTLEQLTEVLDTGPDLVLLDNMSLSELRQAVQLRNRVAPAVELEASGGVQLSTVAGIAASGVDRISVGALTHSATWHDVGLDWSE